MDSPDATKLHDSISSLERAVNRLKEALAEPATNSLMVDGTIQRFEFVVELTWKTLKRALYLEGIDTVTPMESLKRAYQSNWINNETLWLGMLKDRNETSHIYDEGKAFEIYGRIRNYAPELLSLLEFLKSHFSLNNK